MHPAHSNDNNINARPEESLRGNGDQEHIDYSEAVAVGTDDSTAIYTVQQAQCGPTNFSAAAQASAIASSSGSSSGGSASTEEMAGVLLASVASTLRKVVSGDVRAQVRLLVVWQVACLMVLRSSLSESERCCFATRAWAG